MFNPTHVVESREGERFLSERLGVGSKGFSISAKSRQKGCRL